MYIRGNYGSSPLLCNPIAKTSTIHPGTLFPQPPPIHARYDPKHTSRVAQQFYMDSDINWWKTPAESPDMNPIENLWREPTCPLFKFISKQ